MEPLVYLAIIWASVFIANILAEKTRLTPVLFFLFMGALLVNTGILPEQTGDFIRVFAELGIIVIMFALGFEENTSDFMKSIKRSWGIALFGALAPFFTAYVVADYFWADRNVAIMCGLAMTATAVSLTMVSLKSEGLHRSQAAKGIMTSAILDDVGSLVFVAILVPIATGSTMVSLPAIGLIVLKALLFFLIIAAVGMWVLPERPNGLLSRIPGFGRHGVRHVLSIGKGENTTLTVLTVAVLAGLLSHLFGFHPAVGAYMAGLILKEEYFQITATPNVNHYKNTKQILDNVAFSWIGPVFFVNLGAHIVFDWDILLAVIPQTLVMAFALLVAQIASAGLAARYTAGFDNAQSMMVGIGMLGRAELAFVVMDIAYVQYKILNDEAFYTLMGTALVLNIAVPVGIVLWKPHFNRSVEKQAE
ncbi:cation:proton antiporter [Emcibacter nanhaiensis]|uniref:Cation:proton antiporter n=1 Tax=Emcibacter nanhaiensis TaxID=1505037 RepID=A0A501PSL9_9PROT|nr:cation:proton antiporter [Emcibacter nanhaiensis]TPD63042.1 cation:proton antiporter [Emcibacter nanhaiensis]